MIELIETTDAGTVAVLTNDTHASRWIREGKQFFHDETVTKRIAPLIQPGWSCLDVGANLGTFTVAMSRAAGTGGKIIAYEPMLPAFCCLAVNCRGLPNVELTHAALGDGEDRGVMAYDANAGAAHMETRHLVAAHTVVIHKFDNYEIDRLDFVKLDVEGFEPNVIAGMYQTLKQFRPVIFCEVNRGALFRYGFVHQDITRPLLALGYQVEFLDAAHSMDMEQLDIFLVPT